MIHATLIAPCRMLVVRAFIALAWAVAMLLSPVAHAQTVPLDVAAKISPPVALSHAAVVASTANIPPPDTAPWQEVALPDNWYRSRPGFRGTVWYRIPFELPANGVLTHAMHLPRNSSSQIVFWINQYRLAVSNAYGDPRLTELQRPLIYTVPPVMLRPGTNHIYARVTGDADYRHGLTRVTVGYGGGVRQAHYEPRYDLQVTSTAVVGSLLLLAGLLALLLWRADRKDPVLFWFAVTALASSVWSYQQLWPVEITATSPRDLVWFALKYLYATPLLVLCLRVGDVRNAKGEALLWALYAAGCAGAALLPGDHYPALATGALTVYVALFAVFFAWLCWGMPDRARWRVYVLAVAVGAVVVVHGYDLARWLGYADYDNLLLTPYGTFFLILALGTTVVDRHVSAVEQLDRSNRSLELEVATKVNEIEQSYGKMQAMMHEQVVLRERQRIMGDMHDGLGSSLVSMLALVQSGRVTPEDIERRLNSSIIELRAIVDSLEPVDGDLAAVLGNVRYRMRGALEQSGAKFVWSVDDLPRLAHLTPQVILSIERILLEVLSNALQHAEARTLSFSAKVSADGTEIVIRVADDGTGFDSTADATGRGLRSMNDRARRAGLSVDITSRMDGETGTVVTLTVPMCAPEADNAASTVTS